MKKGFIFLLSSFLLIGTPSFIQAEELTESLEPSPLTTENLPIDSLAQQEDSSTLVKTVETVEQPQQLTNDPILSKEDTDSKLSIPLISSLFTKESQETRSSVDTDSITQPSELKAETETIQQPKEEMNSLEENKTESVQTVVEKTSLTSKSPEDKKIKPLVSLNVLGLQVSVLGENEEINSSSKRSLLGISLDESLKLKKQADEQLENNWGLLGIGLGLPVVGNAEIGLLTGKKVKSESGEDITSQGGILGLGISDSKLVGDLNVKVLSGKKEKHNDEEFVSGGLATIDLNNSLGKTRVGVIEGTKHVLGDTTNIHGGILLTDIKDSIIGDAHLGLGEVNKMMSPNLNEIHKGVIVGDINNSILGNNHLSLIEYHEKETEDSKTTSGGLVTIDTKGSPLGDGHIGVGEWSKEENKTPSLNPNEPSEKPNPDDNTKPSDKPIQEGPDQGEKPGQNEKPSNNDPKSEDQTNNGKPSPTSPTTPSKPDQPSKPGQGVIDQDKLPGSDIITLPLLPKEGSNNGGQMTESELVELVGEGQKEIANMNSLDKENSIADFIQELTEAGNKTVLNQQTENDVSQLQEIIDSVNEKMNNSLHLTPASGQTTPSSGSGSVSAGSSVPGGGSGMVACLDYKYLNEVALNNHVNYILNELSDQWINSPPIEPPKAPFFLSI